MRPGILWEGRSVLTGDPIVAILTDKSTNDKTKDMLQVWYLRQDIPPHEAVKEGLDGPVCGDCPLAGGGGCYVLTWQAPRAVYGAYKRGSYGMGSLEGGKVRFGAYGDPAAVPRAVHEPWFSQCDAWTAYTHQWRQPFAQWLKSYAMASIDTRKGGYELAQEMGWRVYEAGEPGSKRRAGSAHCPASKEVGHVMSCSECLACCGVNEKRGVMPTDRNYFIYEH